MKPAYFGQCPYCPNIDKNNYPEETELDSNPTLTLSTGERNFGHFTSNRCCDTTIVNFAYMNSPKNWGVIQSLDKKSTWDEKSQLHEIDA